jgi:phage tail-like protein
MDDHAIRYMVLRDQRSWDETALRVDLVPRTDGALLLRGLPGLASGSPVQGGAAFDAELSGAAIAWNRATYGSITADPGSIVIAECGCCDHLVVSGPTGATPGSGFTLPRGLLVAGDRLLVADSGNARVLVLELPSLRQRDEWKTGLGAPSCLAADSAGRVYVVDSAKVLRFSAAGAPDAVFDAAMAARPELTSPFAIAVDSKNRLYASVSASNAILCFGGEGAAPKAVAPPQGGYQPRALLTKGSLLYVADAKSGSILVYDIAAEVWIGAVEGYRGPVAAMTCDDAGVLYVKPGPDDTVYRLEAEAARVRSGTLCVEYVDAGAGELWERVWVDAEILPETDVVLEVVVASDPELPSSALNWQRSPTLDVLLTTLVDQSTARYLWVRVTLKSLDGRSTPTLFQVQAATVAPSYLDYLPRIYRRDDAATRFLERWLALARTDLGDWERVLEETPRRFDARTVAEADIGKLAAWLALELPARMDPPGQRQLLADAAALYRRRGTPGGLRELVRRKLGATIHIFEAFRERRVWQLGEGLGLGLNTQLAAGAPEGMIVPGYNYVDRALAGLRGDYYEGTKFEILRHTKTDAVIAFNWGSGSPLSNVPSQAQFPKDYFSVRWTGQVRPRYAETYTFRTRSDDGVRLWVAGRLIIDNWTDHAATEDAGQIRLEGGRWYPIVLEYYEKTGSAFIELRWSSANQPSEIVPKECLYSVQDESAEIEPLRHGGCELMEVGSAVVGDGRPQTPADYGAALADDYAHLFTVVVPAAQVPLAAQRQALRELIEAEKPAHTDFDLCLIEPRMRVGVQARLGIDSIVAGAGTPMLLGTAELDDDSYLGGDAFTGRRVLPARVLW